MPLTLQSPIEHLPRVGPTLARRFHRLGLKTIRNLLFHFPFRYDDFRNVVPINRISPGMTATVRGRLSIIENHRSPRKRIMLTEALVSDRTGSMKAIWFNQPWLTKLLKPGDVVFLAGKVERTPYGVEFVAPALEKLKAEQTHTARLVPVYSTTEDLTAKQIRFFIRALLPITRTIPDPFAPALRRREGLLELGAAIREIHFPTDERLLERARHRLAFDELLSLQLRAAARRQQLDELRAAAIPFNEPLVKRFVASLPFRLTNAQRKAAWEILKDLERPRPMNRLLEGDVGSGKTVVAAMVMLNVASRNFQAALMAPTEILAEQHAQTFTNLFRRSDDPPKVALLTGNRSRRDGDDVPRRELLEEIAGGSIDIVVGTHALIEKRARFHQLRLVVVDEQHRFGVEQRFRLWRKQQRTSDRLTPDERDYQSEVSSQKSVVPHLLSMTATPIPRTLALTFYGDLDLSVLDERPPGRPSIRTIVVPPERRDDAYGTVREEIRRGRQGFVICPLIDPSDKLGVRAATKEYERLKTDVFLDLRIGLLHGRLATKKKETVMSAFASGELDLLVSTAVVEVGVDVPNATVMIIEGAERFGLAQLHQFRGRIGRAEHPSTCFLFTDSTDNRALKRLDAVVNLQDGFALAEKDLEMRGQGEIFGTQQSGFPELRFARLNDHELLRKTRQLANELLKTNPEIRKKLGSTLTIHPE